MLRRGENVDVYYGAADTVTGVDPLRAGGPLGNGSMMGCTQEESHPISSVGR